MSYVHNTLTNILYLPEKGERFALAWSVLRHMFLPVFVIGHFGSSGLPSFDAKGMLAIESEHKTILTCLQPSYTYILAL